MTIEEVRKKLEIWKNRPIEYGYVVRYESIPIQDFTREELLVILDILICGMMGEEDELGDKKHG